MLCLTKFTRLRPVRMICTLLIAIAISAGVSFNAPAEEARGLWICHAPPWFPEMCAHHMQYLYGWPMGPGYLPPAPPGGAHHDHHIGK